MSKRTLKSCLTAVYESEIYGCMTFATAKLLSFDQVKKHKWHRLYLLEKQTKERVEAVAQCESINLAFPIFWYGYGVVSGVALAVLPGKLSAKMLFDATEKYLPRFHEIYAGSDPAHKEFFNYVVQHEKALQDYAEGERTRSPDSLSSVDALLSRD